MKIISVKGQTDKHQPLLCWYMPHQYNKRNIRQISPLTFLEHYSLACIEIPPTKESNRVYNALKHNLFHK